MIKLVSEVRKYVAERMAVVARTLPGPSDNLRSVFNGPPSGLLEAVLESFLPQGGIEVELGDGSSAIIPVLLPSANVGRIKNPRVGESGVCDEDFVLEVRNTPGCPRFLTL